MKRKICTLLAVLMMLVCGSVGMAAGEFDSVVPEEMDKDELVDAYNELRDTYNILYDLYTQELMKNGISSDNETQNEDNEKISDFKFDVKLMDKHNETNKYKQKLAYLVFEIKNNYDKSIKGIEGIGTFNDLFGKEILKIQVDFTGMEVAPGETFVKDTLYYECNQFDDKDMKLYNTEYSDLGFIYIPSMVVFSDGTSEEFK